MERYTRMFTWTNLGYRPTAKTSLTFPDIKISQKQNLLLLGPSGCGKTTLMNLMAGFIKPDRGQITFQDQHYDVLSESELDRLRRRHFGFVFQKLHLIGHLSVAQNIAVTQTKPDPVRVQVLIDDLDLSGKERQKARDLSLGEAQRVAIARAVVHHPTVIFADEPTSALDDTNTEKVMELIFDQARKTGATVIAATHDARIKDRFETILEMAA